MSATNGGSTERLDFQCGLQKADVLDRLPSDPGERASHDHLSVSRSRLESWDPEHLTVPEMAHPQALAIFTRAAASLPRLSSPEGWGAKFGRELNATDDRPHFISKQERDAIPIVEGKHLQPFQVMVDHSAAYVPRAVAATLIDPHTSFDRVRLAYRDVASATNRVTLIAALLPRHTLSTHTVFCLKTALDAHARWCLLALLNSLPANYLVRLSVTTHVTTALMARLPVPRPSRKSAAFAELVTLARTLADKGIDAAPEAYARLNAIAATLYGLTTEQYEHVVASFPLLTQELRSQCVTAYIHHTETRKHRSTE
jgi:hypothetical protein